MPGGAGVVAVDRDRNRFVIADEEGSNVAKGKIQAPNLDDELERVSRAQNRSTDAWRSGAFCNGGTRR